MRELLDVCPQLGHVGITDPIRLTWTESDPILSSSVLGFYRDLLGARLLSEGRTSSRHAPPDVLRDDTQADMCRLNLPPFHSGLLANGTGATKRRRVWKVKVVGLPPVTGSGSAFVNI